jgi:hypothetical protein
MQPVNSCTLLFDPGQFLTTARDDQTQRKNAHKFTWFTRHHSTIALGLANGCRVVPAAVPRSFAQKTPYLG